MPPIRYAFIPCKLRHNNANNQANDEDGPNRNNEMEPQARRPAAPLDLVDVANYAVSFPVLRRLQFAHQAL